MKIGIGYTTHNRNEVMSRALKEIKKFMPPGAKLVIVDDASDKLFKGATYRFEENVGIAVAKNKCLQLLDDCDHIFLFDSDCWPVTDKWWEPYINSKEPHLNFTFDRLIDGRQNGNKKVISRNGVVAYSHPCGCMMYVKKHVLDVVGGMDPAFGKWGYEHPSWSRRIFNAGLTSSPFMDVEGSLGLFHSMDYACEVTSSVTKGRRELIHQNKRYYDSQLKSKAYIPYKPMFNFVLSSLFITLVDPQRGETWAFEPEKVRPLRDSINTAGLTVFTDHPGYENKHPGNSDFYYVKPQHDNPYFARWFAYRDYLKHIDPKCFVWCVDATDVEMLRSPFEEMKRGVLYVGDEAGQNTGNLWLRRHHKGFERMHKAKAPLLNAGISGGEAEIVLEFCEHICDLAGTGGQLTDMNVFNWVAYKFFHSRLVHGPKVNTKFKAYADNGVAWFKHK